MAELFIKEVLKQQALDDYFVFIVFFLILWCTKVLKWLSIAFDRIRMKKYGIDKKQHLGKKLSLVGVIFLCLTPLLSFASLIILLVINVHTSNALLFFITYIIGCLMYIMGIPFYYVGVDRLAPEDSIRTIWKFIISFWYFIILILLVCYIMRFA